MVNDAPCNVASPATVMLRVLEGLAKVKEINAVHSLSHLVRNLARIDALL